MTVELTDEFLDKYKKQKSPMTDLGNFVYYRTYSRLLPEKCRREYWWETVKRVVEYNCNLVDNTSQAEAELLYDNIFNLRQFPSGRSLWVGGTESARKFPISNFNCSGLVVDSIDDIAEVFYLMMLGTGVGFRILPSDVTNIPPICSAIDLAHKDYEEKQNKEEFTNVIEKAPREFGGRHIEIIVGDSKEGWVEALREYLKIITSPISLATITMNYDNVRKKGEPLKTFGGTASGHESLKSMFEKLNKIISKKLEKKLETIDVLDICNIIGENVAVGGCRRSAGICLFDVNDEKVRNAKNSIFEQMPDGTWKTNPELLHRTKSNNSIVFYERPSKDKLKEIFNSIKVSGEPGFINGEVAQKRFTDFSTVNPCAEILLPDKGLCNLVTLNMCAFVENGKLNLDKLKTACKLNTRVSYRMACVELELPHWNKNQQDNMLLGCSFTGWQDAMNLLNYSLEEQTKLSKELREVCWQAMREYAKELGRNESKNVTCTKPEGSLSLLPTVSAGLHFSHSPYYIRRVRVNADDPIVKVCQDLGWTINNEVGQTDENCTTKVIDFPCKAPKGKTKYDVSAIEQLEIYKMFMDNYVDQNASNTITVRENEWDDVCDWVYDNWDSFVGVSFLSLDDTYYPLAPYEKISEEKYNELTKDRKSFDVDLLNYYINTESNDDEVISECASGACPIR